MVKNIFSLLWRTILEQHGLFFCKKFQTIKIIDNFLNFDQTQFQLFMKIIRTNNGSEFVNSQFFYLLTSKEILHQLSYIYSPQ